MGRFDRQHEENEKICIDVHKEFTSLQNNINELERVRLIAENAGSIIDNLDYEFENMTKLSREDISFLFFATALQCCRQIIQPTINVNFSKISTYERHDAGLDGNLEFKRGKEIAQENVFQNKKSRKYPDKVQMFELAVPYDAMLGTKNILIPGVSDIGNNISGRNHHAATLGHDPVLGYIFGTINILTRTITFKNAMLTTNLVHLQRGSNRNQYVGKEIGFAGAIIRTLETAQEDITRIPAAVLRQALHIQSDKYTKMGLPIPFIPAETAQKLLVQGWNSYEVERLSEFILKDTGIVAIQALLSVLINAIIEVLYLSMNICSTNEMMTNVKSKKIIMYSNTIASGSNIIATLLSKDLKHLDIGGLCVTLYRIISDKRLIKQIKQEFLEKEFYKIVMDTE